MAHLKTAFLFLFLMGCHLLSHAYPAGSFDDKIKQLQQKLRIYDQLSPYDDDCKIVPEMGITAEDLAEYDGEVMDGQLPSYVIVGIMQDHIVTELLFLLSQKEILNYDVITLFEEEVKIGKSDDGKLLCLMLNEKTGGSYRSRIAIMHYQGGEQPTSWEIESDGYDRLYAIETAQGIHYLGIGEVIGCSTCLDEYVALMRPQKNSEIIFSYSVATRFGVKKHLTYDAKRQLIEAAYVNNDISPTCSCAPDDNELEEDFSVYETKECICQFKFNGKTFELLSKKVRPYSAEG